MIVPHLTYEEATCPKAQPYRVRVARTAKHCFYCPERIRQGSRYTELSAYRWGHPSCVEAQVTPVPSPLIGRLLA